MQGVEYTSDRVTVTRCKNCAFYDTETFVCTMWGQPIDEMGYCVWAVPVPKEGEHD